MATVTKGKTFISGETVEVADMHQLVDAATVTDIVDADISASAAIAASKLATAAQQSLVPAGAVMAFAMNSAPSGWLAANGDAVSRSTYAALFGAIGTAHGSGDGATTFNLPDLRGIFVRGSGEQTITGTTYNKAFALKEKDELKAHTHTVVARGAGASANFAAGGFPVASQTLTTSETGGVETRPANLALLYCVKF